MKRCLCLALLFLFGNTVATAGDTITNIWGTVSYGWVDFDTFAIQLQGSTQTRQIEQDWPDSALLVTNHARRFNDNLYAWQIRKSAQGQFLLIIPNDFAKAGSFTPEEQPQESKEGIVYSEYRLDIAGIFDSVKMVVEGDPIEIWLSWGAEHRMFAFTVPSAPSPTEGP